jgi:acyl-CoA synthetase (AMP-forming)/AMP-acid ligase II
MGVGGTRENREEFCTNSASQAARQAHYGKMGWWPGVRLVERYGGTVQARPNDLAVLDDRGNRLTHGALWEAAGELATAFGSRGICAGDIVIICLPNWIEWQIVHLAIHRLGAIPANIPIRINADMLTHVARLVGARCLVATDRFGGRDIGKTARMAAAGCEHRVELLILDEMGQHSWSENGVAAPPPAQSLDDRLDHVMFTSSTTGMPKAVMHTCDTLAAFNICVSRRFGLGPKSPIFMASPLGHSVGAIHGARLCLFLGSPLVLQQHWDPQAALHLIEQTGCAFTAAATPFLKDLLDLPWSSGTPKLASMKTFLCGGAQVPPALIEQAKTEFPHTFLTVLWGMTEGGVTTCIPGESAEQKVLRTAGVPTPGFELRIMHEDGRYLDPGAEGELVVRGPCMFVGYLGQDEFYRSQLTADGFFRTGDLATLDEDGYLRITGRLKDLIIRGGVNISPVPIEDALAAHADIQNVAVIGFPDPRLGERLCAVIRTENTDLDRKRLTAFLRKSGLPRHFLPEKVLHIDVMPMTPAGKVRKNDVRAWLADRIEAGEVAL